MKSKFFLKFSIVTVGIGILSPSVSLTPQVTLTTEHQASSMQLDISLFAQAEARRDGDGVNRNKNKNRNRNNNKNVNVNKNKNVNKNVNTNVNVNKNVNVNVNTNRRYGNYRGRPLVAFSTALVVGTMVAAATMPTSCTIIVLNGISYKKCENSYYQPFYEGDTLVYKVVASPL